MKKRTRELPTPRADVRGRHLVLAILILATLAFAAVLIRSWFVQVTQLVTCQTTFGQLEERNGYIEIQLERQHPTESYFEGVIFMVSVNRKDAGLSTVSVTRSAQGGYGASQNDVRMIWDPQWQALRSLTPTRLDFVTLSGSHRYFPWDSALFKFSLALSPSLDYKALRVVNRLPGFILDCSNISALRSPGGETLQIAFSLSRNPLVQLAVYVFATATLIFIPLVTLWGKTEGLAVSVASYFFSIWSLRGVLSGEIKTFPTLFDCWLLTVCMLMITALIWRVLTGMEKTRQDA